jgi:hypothetical protein
VSLILHNIDNTGQFILPNPRKGPFAPSRDWDALKRAYEAPGAEPIQVAEANGILLTTLRQYAKGKNWNLSSVAPTVPSNARPLGPTLKISSARGALTKRLRKTVALKLEKLNMDIEASPSLSPADHERHSRAIGTLAKAAEIVDDNSHAGATGARRTAAGKPAAAPETAGNDEDKLRRELAARIQSLRERLAR